MTAKVRTIQSSFASGELSPELYGRVDLQQYANGLKECRNFVVKPHGGVVNRPGFEHVCEVKDSSAAVRLIPFNFNTEQTYVLEFGNLYMRVIANGGLITDAAVTIVSTTEDNPVEVTATGCAYQDGDRVYISGVGYATSLNGRWFTVTRINDNEFSLDGEDGTGIGVGEDGSVERAYVLTTPYTQGEISALDFTQSADVMTLVHPNWTPRELSRTGHNAWTLEEINFLPGIGKPQDLTSSTMDTGGNHEYAVTAISEETGEESQAAYIDSDYQGLETLTWSEVEGASAYNVYRDDGVTHRIHGFIGTSNILSFVDMGPTTPEDEIEPEWSITPPETYEPFGGNPIEITAVSTDNPCEITTDSNHGYSTGDRVYIDDGSDEPDINMEWYTITVIDADEFSLDGVDGGDKPLAWSEGGFVEKFDGNGNCPSAVTYYEQRLVFGATDNNPQKIWLSQSAAFHNFDTSRPSRDSDAIIFTIASQEVNRIRNLIPMRDLIILTSGGEWRANGGDSELMTATGGLAVRRQTDFGSGDLPAITVGNTTIYYQERGPSLRTIAYSFTEDQYMGVDLSILSQHLLTGHTMVAWTYAQAPFGVIWGVRSDGVLLGLTYQQEHKVWAWHQHQTEGTFESIISILEGAEDAVYVVVQREIDGTDVRFVERMRGRTASVASMDVRDGCFLDCSLSLDVPLDITGITKAEPPVVTAVDHGFSEGDYVDISDVEGMTEVNDHQYKANWVLAAANTITAITKATPAVVTSAAHGYSDGDRVFISDSDMTEVNGREFVVNWILSGSDAIEGISKAAEADVTLTGHSFNTGDRVYIEGIVGMTELNGREFVVTDKDANTITLDDEDSTDYTTWVSGGTVELIDPDDFELEYEDSSGYVGVGTDGFCKQISADTFRLTDSVITGIAIDDMSLDNPVQVLTTNPHGFATGDVVYIRDVVGQVEVNDRWFTITRVAEDQFSLDGEDGGGHTAYTSGGTATANAIDATGYTAYTEGGYAREAVTTLRGIEHLNGETISILANGMKHPAVAVADGTITLTYPASRVHAGIAYISQLETLPVEIPSQQGTLQGTRQSVSEVILRVHDSVGFWAGPDEDNLLEARWRSSEDFIYDQAVAMFTGDVEPVAIIPGWNRGTSIVIRQVDPLPLAINALMAEVQLGT